MTQTLLALVALAVSVLQAWDARALEASASLQLVIAAAVALPGFAILRSRQLPVRLVAVGVSALLLAGVRMAADVHMPELVLAAVFPGILALLDHFRLVQASAGKARG